MVDISYLKPLSQACITLYLLQNFGLHIQQKQLLATLVYILEIPHHKNSSGSSQTLIYNISAAITRCGTIDSGPSAVLYTILRLNFILIPILTLQQTRTYHCPVIRHIFMRLRPTVPVLVLLITAITFISTLIYSMLN